MEQWIKQEGDFCSLNSLFYPITSNKECIIQLFLRKSRDINKHCNILIEPNPNDPRITYLNNGKWLVISSKVCNAKVQQYGIKSPVDTLTLRQGCWLFCIIIKFRKQISKRCKTTKDKWSVKFEGKENAVSKPPS